MNPTEAMHMIEGLRFAALTNLASNVKTFLRIAVEQSEVEVLSRAMANDPAVNTEVFHRAMELSVRPGDGELEQEGDAALAIYLWLLSNHQPELAKAAADSLREQEHFFWARKFADDLCKAKRSANENRSGADGETASEITGEIEAFHRKP